MCGIYGAILQHPTASQKVYEGLKRLEYRGYDSWGVVVGDGGKLELEKYVGKIAEQSAPKLPQTKTALGHTRWATHGGVTDLNAHPHLAKNGSFALVQNGVVENYQELKASLVEDGYEFASETDTEVIVGLVEAEMSRVGEDEPTVKTVCKVFKQLDGRNTIALLTQNGKIIAVRDGSPLVMGRNKAKEYFVSSDVLSLSEDGDEYVMIEHGQGVELTADGVRLFEVKSGKNLKFEFAPIELIHTQLDTGGYEHFMLKEIHEQAEVWQNVLQQPEEMWVELVSLLKSARHVYTLGAGSAHFAAESMAYFLREAEINATGIPAYEATSYRDLWSKDDVAIVFSQSGETADTNEVVEWMLDAGLKIVSIVNMPGSTLTSLSKLPFMLQVGSEVGVASTKALTGHLLWGWTAAQLVKDRSLKDIEKLVENYQSSVKKWLTKTESQLKKLANKLISREKLFVLGRGQLFASTREFALKMKEISYIHAEGFSGGELKHGVIALLEKGTPVVSLIAEDKQKADMLSATAEVKARGAWTIGVATENNELFDEWIQLPAESELAFISAVLPAQLMTYFMAVKKGFDPDKPRNLAKSVTVK